MLEVVVVITGFIKKLQASGYAESTIEGYTRNLSIFERHLSAHGIDDLRKVTQKVIHKYQQSVASEPLATESKAMRIRPVKRLFEHLVDTHRLLINPTEGIEETCRKGRKIGPVLTVEEVKRLLAQPNLKLKTGIRDRAVMEVLYSSGIRLAELLGLGTYDADLKERVLFIRKGKGRKDRVVPIGKNAVSYINLYLKTIRPGFPEYRPNETLLFLNQSGHPLSKGSVQGFLRKYRFAADIEKPVSPHTLRRTCATHLLQKGADIRYIQKLLGHKYLRTTQAYTKIMPVDVKQMHQRTHPNKGGIKGLEG